MPRTATSPPGRHLLRVRFHSAPRSPNGIANNLTPAGGFEANKVTTSTRCAPLRQERRRPGSLPRGSGRVHHRGKHHFQRAEPTHIDESSSAVTGRADANRAARRWSIASTTVLSRVGAAGRWLGPDQCTMRTSARDFHRRPRASSTIGGPTSRARYRCRSDKRHLLIINNDPPVAAGGFCGTIMIPKERDAILTPLKNLPNGGMLFGLEYVSNNVHSWCYLTIGNNSVIATELEHPSRKV